MVWLHVMAGLTALASGAVALYATKGDRLHRRSGNVFAIAMLVMTTSAVIMAGFLRPNIGNVIAGTLTFYLVVTGVLAVTRTVAQVRALLLGLMLVAGVVGSSALALGLAALQRANGAIDGIPAPAFFMFALVGLAAALLDVRLLIVGHLQGRHRLARHLWRMGYAMWIATLSFFVGQADVFSRPIRSSGVLMIPVVLVTGSLLYWIVRVLFARSPLPARARETTPRATAEAAQTPAGRLRTN